MKFTFALLLSLLCLHSWGQQNEEKEVERTIARLYNILSYADSSSMKIDSLPALFTSDGKLIANFGKKPFVYSPAQFVQNIRDNTSSGQIRSATERELVRKVDVFGKIANVLSTYEFTIVGKDGKVIRRGLNAIQLIEDRWQVVDLLAHLGP